jgi:hypothetical protein
MRITRKLALLALPMLFAACSDSGVDPVQVPADIGQLLSQAEAPAAVSGVMSSLGVPGFSASACPYSAATQSFVCPSQTNSGITMTRSYQVLDGSGAPMSAVGAGAAAIRVTTGMSGTVTPPAIPGAPGTVGPATVQHSSVMTLAGLGASQERRLNGTSAGTVSASLTMNGSTVPLTLVSNDTVSNLVLPASPGSGDSPRFPLSGSTIHNETVNLGPLVAHRLRVVTTFNVTSSVQVQMSVNGQGRTCTANLGVRPPVVNCS